MLKRFQDLLSMVTLTSLVFSFVATTTRGNVQPKNQPAQMPTAETAPDKLPQSAYGKMPLLFEENKGQTDRQAKFVSRGAGYTLYLAETEAVFQLRISDSGLRNEIENPKTKTAKTK